MPKRKVARVVAILIVEAQKMVNIGNNHNRAFIAKFGNPFMKAGACAHTGQKVVIDRMFKLGGKFVNLEHPLPDKKRDRR